MLMDTLMLGRHSGSSVSHPGLFDSHYAMLHIGMTFPLSPAALSLPLGHWSPFVFSDSEPWSILGKPERPSFTSTFCNNKYALLPDPK